jgi:hypothetical protein
MMDRPTFSPIKLDTAVEAAIAEEEDKRQTIAEVNAVLAWSWR